MTLISSVKIPWTFYILFILYMVQLSTQAHVQSNNHELMVTSLTRAFVNLENRLEGKLSDLLVGKMSEIIENKMAHILEAKLSGIMEGKLTEMLYGKFSSILKEKLADNPQDKVAEIVENKLSDVHSSLRQIKDTVENLPNLFDEKLSDVCHRLGQIENNIGDIKSDIYYIKGKVQTMEGDMVSLGQRSSLSQTASERTLSELIKMEGKLMNTLQALNTKVTSLEENDRKLFNHTSVLQNKLQNTHETFLQKIKNTVKTIESSFKRSPNIIEPEPVLSCSESSGFFRLPSSDQCYKPFLDLKREWPDADSKCKSEGLALAEPNNIVALRKYLREKYDMETYYWVGACADGTRFRWQRDGTELSNSSPLWRPGNPGRSSRTTEHCIDLIVYDWGLEQSPDSPYSVGYFTNKNYALCEVVNE